MPCPACGPPPVPRCDPRHASPAASTRAQGRALVLTCMHLPIRCLGACVSAPRMHRRLRCACRRTRRRPQEPRHTRPRPRVQRTARVRPTGALAHLRFLVVLLRELPGFRRIRRAEGLAPRTSRSSALGFNPRGGGRRVARCRRGRPPPSACFLRPPRAFRPACRIGGALCRRFPTSRVASRGRWNHSCCGGPP